MACPAGIVADLDCSGQFGQGCLQPDRVVTAQFPVECLSTVGRPRPDRSAR
jgi:hypothetical protein